MADRTIAPYLSRVLNFGSHDALIDGNVIKDIQTRLVLVASQAELASFADKEPIGTIAVQYGFKKLWQLKPDRTWEAM